MFRHQMKLNKATETLACDSCGMDPDILKKLWVSLQLQMQIQIYL